MLFSQRVHALKNTLALTQNLILGSVSGTQEMGDRGQASSHGYYDKGYHMCSKKNPLNDGPKKHK